MVQFEIKNNVWPHIIPINGLCLVIKLMRDDFVISKLFSNIIEYLLKLFTPYFEANNEMDMHQFG